MYLFLAFISEAGDCGDIDTWHFLLQLAKIFQQIII